MEGGGNIPIQVQTASLGSCAFLSISLQQVVISHSHSRPSLLFLINAMYLTSYFSLGHSSGQLTNQRSGFLSRDPSTPLGRFICSLTRSHVTKAQLTDHWYYETANNRGSVNKTLQRIKRLGPLFTEYMSEFISEKKRSTFFIHTIYSLKTFIINIISNIIIYLCVCYSLHLVFLLDQSKIVSSEYNHIDRN